MPFDLNLNSDNFGQFFENKKMEIVLTLPHTFHFQLLQTLNIGKKQSKAKISRINRQYCRRRHTDELGEALAYTKSKSISASMSWPVTEAELAHYEEVMEILKSRWSGIPAEAKVKMATVNDDSVQREESMNEFKATWARHANSDDTLTREEFCAFNRNHLSNIKARLGWAPAVSYTHLTLPTILLV